MQENAAVSKEASESIILDLQQQLAEMAARITLLVQERDAFLHGGVTEELLRKQNGFLKVGKGCVIVREDEYRTQAEEIGRLREFARAVKTGLDFEVHEGRSLSRLEDLYDQAKALAGEKEGA